MYITLTELCAVLSVVIAFALLVLRLYDNKKN